MCPMDTFARGTRQSKMARRLASMLRAWNVFQEMVNCLPPVYNHKLKGRMMINHGIEMGHPNVEQNTQMLPAHVSYTKLLPSITFRLQRYDEICCLKVQGHDQGKW